MSKVVIEVNNVPEQHAEFVRSALVDAAEAIADALNLEDAVDWDIEP